MSFGPPRNPNATPFSYKQIHRLAERFPEHPDVARAEEKRKGLQRALHEHLYNPQSGVSWLDALLYERLFSDRVVDVPSLKREGGGSSSREGGVLEYWSPSTTALTKLIKLLDQQAVLRQKCISAILRRNRILESLLTKTCVAARQVELRERELRRNVLTSGVVTPQAQSGSPRSPTKGLGAVHQRTFTVKELWPTDFTRLFLYRCSPNRSFDVCLQRTNRCLCNTASHILVAKLLTELDEATDEVVSCVINWRTHLNRPLPFLFNGHNVLLMIQYEMETILPSIITHLVDQAGGQPMYNGKQCPFYFASRYAQGGGGTVTVGGESKGGKKSGSGSAAQMIGKLPSFDVAKTLSSVVSRELAIQMKFAEEIITMVNDKGTHVPPLNHAMIALIQPSARTGQSAEPHVVHVDVPLGRSSLPQTLDDPRPSAVAKKRSMFARGSIFSNIASASDNDDASLGELEESSKILPYVAEVRAEAAAVRKYVERNGTQIFPLPLIVSAPKKWFSADTLTANLTELGIIVRDMSVAAQKSIEDFVAAQNTLAIPSEGSFLGANRNERNKSVSVALSVRGDQDSPSTTPAGALSAAMALQKSSSSCFNTNTAIPEIELPDSLYVPIVVLDKNGHLTSGGLHYILHRELEHDCFVVIRTRQWLRDCYAQARAILEEPFGSVVEPFLQELQREQEERDLEEAQFQAEARETGENISVIRSRKKRLSGASSRRKSLAATTEDFGRDHSLDRLVLQCYGKGSAVTDEMLSLRSERIARGEPAVPPEEADDEAHQRLITLQRRSVKRFGLRMLRLWVRSHLQSLHRKELVADLSQKNMLQLMRQRLLSWMRLVHRRRRGRERALKLLVTSANQHLLQRYRTWKHFLLGRAIAKSLNAWLFQNSYRRWLYPVCRKRVVKILAGQAAPRFLEGKAWSLDSAGRRAEASASAAEPSTAPTAAESVSLSHHWLDAMCEVGTVISAKRPQSLFKMSYAARLQRSEEHK